MIIIGVVLVIVAAVFGLLAPTVKHRLPGS